MSVALIQCIGYTFPFTPLSGLRTAQHHGIYAARTSDGSNSEYTWTWHDWIPPRRHSFKPNWIDNIYYIIGISASQIITSFCLSGGWTTWTERRIGPSRYWTFWRYLLMQLPPQLYCTLLSSQLLVSQPGPNEVSYQKPDSYNLDFSGKNPIYIQSSVDFQYKNIWINCEYIKFIQTFGYNGVCKSVVYSRVYFCYHEVLYMYIFSDIILWTMPRLQHLVKVNNQCFGTWVAVWSSSSLYSIYNVFLFCCIFLYI